MTLTSSVVVCTFNGIRYLPSLWESVLAQSRLADEIVVRDDASTDGTGKLGESFTFHLTLAKKIPTMIQK